MKKPKFKTVTIELNGNRESGKTVIASIIYKALKKNGFENIQVLTNDTITANCICNGKIKKKELPLQSIIFLCDETP